jgi:hypothetical protein
MEKSPTLIAAYDQAVEGRTGIDAFDAWARELETVGWLHPAARRAFASLWTFSLRLPWELGCDLFGRMLVDAEPAEDLLLWREVAGLQPGASAFVVTVAHIAEMTANRFRPRLALVDEHAAPLAPDPLPDPNPPDPPDPPCDLIEGGRTGLLLTEANLDEALWSRAQAGRAGVALSRRPALALADRRARPRLRRPGARRRLRPRLRRAHNWTPSRSTPPTGRAPSSSGAAPSASTRSSPGKPPSAPWPNASPPPAASWTPWELRWRSAHLPQADALPRRVEPRHKASSPCDSRGPIGDSR